MVYDFTSRESERGRVVFALTLHRKRMTERVIIGRTVDVRQRLETKADVVYYDVTRPLGSLLLTFESDKTGVWNRNGDILRDSYGNTFPNEAERWKMAAPVSEFLRQKCKKGEPSAMFAAIHTWEDYLDCLHKIEEWQLVFRRCKACGKDFLAKSRHIELCSDECRKQQAAIAKREFDERAKGDRLEQLDEAAYYYWYNRLRKLRKGKAANSDAAASFKAAFDEYRKEAVRRKGAVKRRESQLAEYSEWLVQQQAEADRLMDANTRCNTLSK